MALLEVVSDSEPTARLGGFEEWSDLHCCAGRHRGKLPDRAVHERVAYHDGTSCALESVAETGEPLCYALGLRSRWSGLHAREIDQLRHRRPKRSISGQVLEIAKRFTRADGARNLHADEAANGVDHVSNRHSSGRRSD